MLSHSKLPNSFWGEAIRTSIDLIKFSISVPLKWDVPKRVWTRKNISYDHLRVFGCRAFFHIPNLMSRPNHVFFWGMVMKNLGTGYGIQ